MNYIIVKKASKIWFFFFRNIILFAKIRFYTYVRTQIYVILVPIEYLNLPYLHVRYREDVFSRISSFFGLYFIRSLIVFLLAGFQVFDSLTFQEVLTYVSRKRYQSIDGTPFLPLTAANINLSRRSFNFRNYYVRKTKLVISTYVILNWEKFQCIISNEVCLSTGLYHLRQLCRLKTLLFSLGGSLHHHLPSNNNTKTQIENEGEWIYYLLFEIWHWWHMVWNIGITAIGRKKRKRWRDIVKKLSTTKEREREREREMMCYIQTDRYLDPNFISLESKEE